MAKGGNSQRSNCLRFTKPYDASNVAKKADQNYLLYCFNRESNELMSFSEVPGHSPQCLSFVKKVALRVSGYIGGLFGSSVKADDSVSGGQTPFIGTDDACLTHSHYETTDSGKPLGMSRCYDDVGVNNSPGKTLKVGTKRKFVPDLPISPIASTSSLFQSSVNHNYDIQNSEDFITSVAGPSGLQNQKYLQTNSITTSASTNTNIKANGATDNHSDSSESTSGCSSLVPQSDRLSQSAFVSNSRKKILEEKLQYVRQLKQNRTSMYLNRSIPVVGDTAGSKRKPSFDVSVYGSPIFIKSSVREKMVNSPFYTGQTSYGGASAYRRTRASLNPQPSGRSPFERKEGVQIQVKPSHHGSTEDMSNMSHTAKRILEALEQFSTPISDAKRIPVNASSPPLGRKRTRCGDYVESVASLSTLKSPSLNRGPVISGLNVPTVPDLLKLKRLEKIRDSTAAARQVAVQKKEYSLPTDVKPSKHTGKIITKMKDKEKQVDFERPPEVNLPKIPLPISTLPKFDFKLPPVALPTVDNTATTKSFKTASVGISVSTKLSEPKKTFKFSPPIPLQAPENIKNSSQKNNFTFSTPLKANSVREKSESSVLSNLSNFMSPEALSKLKRKSVSDKPNSTLGLEPSKELKCGSVMDFLRKTLENSKQLENESPAEKSKPGNDTWECNSCLIRNLNDSKNCSGCKAPRNSVPSNKDVNTSTVTTPTTSAPSTDSNTIIGFGNKFKPPSGSWSCKECFVVNNAAATKCIACENPKPQSNSVKEPVSQIKAPEIIVAPDSKDNDTKSTILDDAVNTRKNDGWSNLTPASTNILTNAFSSEAQNKSPKKPSFSFGSADNAEKPLATTNFIFGSNLKMPEVVPSSGTGFTFGQSNSVNSQTVVNTSCPSNVPSKTSPLSKSGFSGKEQTGFSSNLDIETTKNDEKTSDLTATSVTFTTTTSTVCSSNESEGADKKNGSDKPMAPFTFGVPSSMTAPVTTLAISTSTPNVFTFGIPKSESKPLQFSGGFGQNSNTFTFGNASSAASNMFGTFSQPKTGTTFGNANAPFGNSAPKLFGQEGETGNNDLSKSSSFPKFGFSGKGDQAGVGSNILNIGTVKNVEKVSDQATTSITLTTTTSTVCSSNESEGADKKNGSDKPMAPFTFGVPSSMSAPVTTLAISTSTPNVFTFGIPKSESKPLQFSGGFGQNSNTFTFGNASSAASNMFGTFSQPKTGTTFGNANAPFGNSAPKLFGQEGETGNNDLSKSSSFPKFGFSGKGDQAGLTSNIPNADTTKNIEKIADTNTTSTALTTATNSLFGSSESGRLMGKSTAPFVFGDTQNNSAQTNNPAMQATAPNVFTFGAPKQESKPLQFSGGFGQSSGTFTFGNPNPTPSNIFGSFDQPKTESPFGNTNAPFGNPNPGPFGQSSAPASFGSSAPKFEFGTSSQQTQSAQRFQFGATSPQTMASSAPTQNFSISIPESFNFTRGQTPTFSATPSSTPKGPTRRVARAVRRTQR